MCRGAAEAPAPTFRTPKIETLPSSSPIRPPRRRGRKRAPWNPAVPEKTIFPVDSKVLYVFSIALLRDPMRNPFGHISSFSSAI